MSTKDQVYNLERELAFWERVHEHEGPTDIEFALESKIRQLKNCDQFGTPRWNGHVHDDEEVDSYSSGCAFVRCRYCKKVGLTWSNSTGAWRLMESGAVHSCKEYQEFRAQSQLDLGHSL